MVYYDAFDLSQNFWKSFELKFEIFEDEKAHWRQELYGAKNLLKSGQILPGSARKWDKIGETLLQTSFQNVEEILKLKIVFRWKTEKRCANENEE